MRTSQRLHGSRRGDHRVGCDGPFFHYSDTWQLIINTGTTIVTFLMVFLLQNTQNRDTAAIQLKLDELIRANRDARNMMFGLEDLSEEELKKVKATFKSLADAPAAIEHVMTASGQLEDASSSRRPLSESPADDARTQLGFAAGKWGSGRAKR